jgi:bifunctional oligoribonuclease and PAP phosphatase NrnA
MQDLIKQLRAAQSAAVVAHIRPDGDAVGSVLGLTAALRQIGTEVTPVLRDGVPRAFTFINGSSEIRTELPDGCDVCIVLDSPDSARTGFTEQVRAYGTAGKLILIDHHVKGDLMSRATDVLHRESASSTAELVAELCIAMGIRLTPSICTSLLTGMYTDTGGFQHSNATNRALGMAGELMRRGGRLNKIVQNLSRQRSVASLKLLGIALSRLTLTPDGQGAITLLSQEDMKACNAEPDDTAGLVGALNVLPQVAYCVLLTETDPGTVTCMLRTAEGHTVDVSKLAVALGGGGHPKASGFSLHGHILFKDGSWRIENTLIS